MAANPMFPIPETCGSGFPQLDVKKVSLIKVRHEAVQMMQLHAAVTPPCPSFSRLCSLQIIFRQGICEEGIIKVICILHFSIIKCLITLFSQFSLGINELRSVQLFSKSSFHVTVRLQAGLLLGLLFCLGCCPLSKGKIQPNAWLQEL